ncbi:hypothetical protein KI387_037294, partial [Taxus chinensis]
MQILKRCLEDSKIGKHQISDVVLIGGSSSVPKVQELLRQFSDGKELCRSINPDEAVAHGAALHAANFFNNKDGILSMNVVLVDVNLLSLGIKSGDDSMQVIVPRNTALPTKREITMHTLYDNHTNVTLKVFEGERRLTAHNNFLGEFSLAGIPAAPAVKIRIK